MFPCFLHAPHKHKRTLYKDFRRIRDIWRVRGVEHQSNRVALVSYNNLDRKLLLEEVLRLEGVHLHVLASDVRPWTWMAKIRPLLEFALSSNADFLICLDANDILPVRIPSYDEVECLFQDRKRGVLFCNDTDFLQDDLFHEIDLARRQLQLSAGAYAARRADLVLFLRLICRLDELDCPWTSIDGTFDDQQAWRTIRFLFQHRIGVDSDAHLFGRYPEYRDEVLRSTGRNRNACQ